MVTLKLVSFQLLVAHQKLRHQTAFRNEIAGSDVGEAGEGDAWSGGHIALVKHLTLQ